MNLLKRVLNAKVADVLPEPTRLDVAPRLSERLGLRVLLKREDLTPVFSFKVRGAYNRIAGLDAEQLARGVITASAGNHAQGVAYACQLLGAECRIVMPATTPPIKVDAVRRLGARIDLVGDSYSEAAAFCAEVVSQTAMTFVPPFDDLDVIAGQGTIGLEVLRQAPRDLASIYLPVGGGGLASGVGAVTKELRPGVKVFGVQPEGSDSMFRSLQAGHVVELDHVDIFADGVAVKRVGEHTFRLCQQYLDGIIRVSTDEICAAIQDGFLDTRSIWEPAGALAVAGLKRHRAQGLAPEGSSVCIASGANIPFTRLGYIAERVEVGEHREALLAVTIPERPGSFREFIDTLGDHNITEFNYRLTSRAAAQIFVGVEVSQHADVLPLIDLLTTRGYACVDLSDDELAKSHVRHMVGGISSEARDEVLFGFELPGRPGALHDFLDKASGRYNICLFHFRNHGAAFQRALCGFEVPQAERADFLSVLDSVGFAYSPVSGSPAASFLLKPEDREA